MVTSGNGTRPNILILATLSGGYRAADATGQAHLDYAPNAFVLPVLSAAMFPERFYLQAFDRGIDGILVMYSGTDCPYPGAAERTAEIVNRTYDLMKERDLDPRRLRLTAICTVCVRPFLEEIENMNRLLDEIGPVRQAATGTEVSPARGQA
jgi:coenzyme F420-reducing hydrogenase delta subunit